MNWLGLGCERWTPLSLLHSRAYATSYGRLGAASPLREQRSAALQAAADRRGQLTAAHGWCWAAVVQAGVVPPSMQLLPTCMPDVCRVQLQPASVHRGKSSAPCLLAAGDLPIFNSSRGPTSCLSLPVVPKMRRSTTLPDAAGPMQLQVQWAAPAVLHSLACCGKPLPPFCAAFTSSCLLLQPLQQQAATSLWCTPVPAWC